MGQGGEVSYHILSYHNFILPSASDDGHFLSPSMVFNAFNCTLALVMDGKMTSSNLQLLVLLIFSLGVLLLETLQ